MRLHRPQPAAAECIFCAFRSLIRPRRPRNGRSARAFTTASPRQAEEIAREGQPTFRIRRDYVRGGQDWIAQRPVVRRVDHAYRDTESGQLSSSRTERAYDTFKKTRFKRVVLDRLDAIEPRLRGTPIFEGMDTASIDRLLGQFRLSVRSQFGDNERGLPSQETELQSRLFAAMKERGQKGLDSELQYTLYNHVLGKNFTREDLANQKQLADLRFPTEWFPMPRQMHRTIHAHIGPTNSGKTYHALRRLESAKAGLYAGPLRLLAHEVYTRLNAKGKLCALVTGEEQRLPSGWAEASEKVVSATVEMTSLASKYDVAIIDEIQMLGSLERGFAWTQALLGLNAKEIHLCGEVRALPIIKELAAACGDKLVVHEYERLTRLKMDKGSLQGSFKGLRKGDCIVTFSVVNIHALRTEVEKKTGRKVAVVYGSLPPETRAQQARLFNDPDNEYDYLIASDAVGMGLNLSIKRMIFETVHKFHGGKLTTLSVSEIRQIAGRAGRYRTSLQAEQDGKDPSIATPPNPSNESTPDILEQDPPSEVSTSTTETPPSPGLIINKTSQPNELEIPSFLHPTKPASLYYANGGARGPALPPLPPEPTLSTRATFDSSTIGLVTTLDAADFAIVAAALDTEPPPLTFATIQPPPGIVQRFASYFPPGTPFSYVLMRLTELSETIGRYRIFHKEEMLLMADLIHGVEGLSTEDIMIFINAPGSIKDPAAPRAKLLKELARCIGSQRGGDLLSLQHLPLDILDAPTTGTKARLKELEELHKGLVLYLWLSFRFPGVFSQRPLCTYVKELVEGEIEETLRLMTFKPGALRRKELRAREVKGSRVEEEIERIVRESVARREGDGEEGEAGEDAAARGEDGNGERGLAEGEMGIAEAVENEDVGESMPEDDEGAYPEEAEDGDERDAAKDEEVPLPESETQQENRVNV